MKKSTGHVTDSYRYGNVFGDETYLFIISMNIYFSLFMLE